ncbi:hypothetical protein [Streptomyces sp. Z26]|uniref:hypothetical protein n=1 Tax=Streptomyces sp. Z26 TaxID=2500177 RepID=UPI000EF156CB|nr:hypothetical protein [Streptomyces sp. Z26]RLL65920.1 hypothetical protein D7M15_02275 [Streptomyces sp. Z26]
MQPSAGPGPLPHTRSRAVHWAATAVALAAVLGLSAAVQPSGATARTAPTGKAPDPASARYPLGCPGDGRGTVDVLEHGAADFDGDGQRETVALVRCAAATGTPPNGMFVLAHADGARERPRIAATLLPPGEGMTADDFAVTPGGAATVSATLRGYSSPDVPRCCPDRERKVKWRWKEGKFVLIPAPVAGSV